MGLFGDQDAAEVSDNPFYVAPDTYLSVLSDMALNTSKAGDKTGLSFKWVIEEEGEFEGQNVSEWITIHFNDDSGDATAIRRDRARLKSRLTQIGMSVDEMNDLVLEDGSINDEVANQYIGLSAYVEVTESKDRHDDTKIYTNIKKVTLLVNV